MWKVGQKIVAIKSHSQGIFKEGDVFTIKSIHNNICKCPLLKFDIGFNTNRFISYCPLCNSKMFLDNHLHSIWLFNENLFKPLEDNFAEEVLENVIKEELILN